MRKIKDKIKVVFWDLDDTLWKGTLAEGDDVTLIDHRITIIRELNRRGIVSSICSKNEYEQAKKKLIEFGIWEQFVFPCISFQPKGEMIHQTLQDMGLRPDNTLFIDDNEMNLREVEYYNPNASVLNSADCDNLLFDDNLKGKQDPELTRYHQYKLLEEKTEIKKTYSSNDSFLAESNIQVEFLAYDGTLLDRLFELSDRTNQLNFTKNRMTKEELSELAAASDVRLELIRVTDNFGDYGIVGFYALKDNTLIHFVFSCRIMNMNIEQFIYAYLGYPDLEIVGEVAAAVHKDVGQPEYISVKNAAQDAYDTDSIEHILNEDSSIHIYGLGACDLYHPIAHFSMPNQKFIYECNVFKGKERGVNVGTEYIRSIIEMTEEEKAFCRRHFYNYTGSLAFQSEIFKKNYDYIILSFHDDEVYQIYEKKSNPNLRVLLSPSRKFGDTSIINEDQTMSFPEKSEWLSNEFQGGHFITPERFRSNLEFISEWVFPDTKFILITGPEIDFFRDNSPHCPEVHNQILALNRVIWEMEKEYPQKFAVADINKVIRSTDDVTNYVYHLKANTAYNLFIEIVWTIIRKSGLPPNKPSMLAPVLNGRKVIIFGNNYEARNAFYNLKLGKVDPIKYIHFDYQNKKVGSMQVEDCQPYIHDKENYYFVVADEKNYPKIRALLEQNQCESLRDFVHLKPVQYKKVWNEEI